MTDPPSLIATLSQECPIISLCLMGVDACRASLSSQLSSLFQNSASLSLAELVWPLLHQFLSLADTLLLCLRSCRYTMCTQCAWTCLFVFSCLLVSLIYSSDVPLELTVPFNLYVRGDECGALLLVRPARRHATFFSSVLTHPPHCLCPWPWERHYSDYVLW